MTNEFTLKAALRGLATEFTPGEQPPQYAQALTNRFINLDGDCESRPGISNDITLASVCAAWTGKWVLVHEHLKENGQTIDFATQIVPQDNEGNPITGNTNYVRVAKKDPDTSEWVPVEVVNTEPDNLGFYTLQLGFSRDNAFTQSDEIDRPITVQFNRSSIFSMDNITTHYYDERLDKFYPLNSLINAGTVATSSSAAELRDANINNWATETLVAPNDLVYNATRNSWAIVTSVGASALEHTPMTTAAAGGAGLGLTTANLNGGGSQESGDRYEIWDLIENNFLPVDSNTSDLDNIAVAASGTNSSIIEVSSSLIAKATTPLRPGDYIYNTSKNSVQRIARIDDRSLNNGLKLTMTASAFSGEVSGQTFGDTLIFLKSAVPVASYNHVHYGRLYLVDAREKTRIFPSGPDDFRDFTTFNQVLNTSTLDFGARQPKGEEILSLDTYDRYLVASGRRNIYVSEGVNPIVDTSVANTDFQPVGLFSQGTISKRPTASIGGGMLYISRDGLRSFGITDILAVQTDNVSEVIKTEIREALESDSIDEKDIQVHHYPRRNWVMVKIGDVIYNFNYTPVFLDGQIVPGGTWSKFTGGLAECDNFILRSNGDISCSYYNIDDGVTYFFNFDKGGYLDGTLTFSTSVPRKSPTIYETAWIGPGDGRLIHNRGLRPFLTCETDTNYTITIEGDLEQQRVDDTIIVSAQGNSTIIQNWQVGSSLIGGSNRTNRDKYPLRTYTDYFKVKFETSGGTKDVISKSIFYGHSYDTR